MVTRAYKLFRMAMTISMWYLNRNCFSSSLSKNSSSSKVHWISLELRLLSTWAVFKVHPWRKWVISNQKRSKKRRLTRNKMETPFSIIVNPHLSRAPWRSRQYPRLTRTSYFQIREVVLVDLINTITIIKLIQCLPSILPAETSSNWILLQPTQEYLIPRVQMPVKTREKLLKYN
jgi:hypothetical protein